MKTRRRVIKSMFRRLLKASAIVLCSVPTHFSHASDQLSTADVCEKALPSVFRILLVDPLTGTLTGIGSGFFIKPDGTALTAYHVLAPGHSVVAKLDSGEQCAITFISGHQPVDVALVKVQTTGHSALQALELGDSDELRRGEQVVHIGNTLFSNTNDIDVGYINKLEDDTPHWLQEQLRGDLAAPDSGLNFIKTAGNVRPGFSGGPLVNMRGQAVGLISRVYVQMHQTGPEHEGASIPINFVKTVVKQLEVDGRVERPYIGLSFTRAASGLAVVKVQPSSPAESAGLRVGDILQRANGRAMRCPEDFFKTIGYQKGILVSVEVQRGDLQLHFAIAT